MASGGTREKRVGGWAYRSVGVSRQSYFFLMRTNRPPRRYARTPIRVPSRPSRNADLIDGQPSDKSPGYYRVSLRDEVKTGFHMSKL
jgi:hypothetical protein